MKKIARFHLHFIYVRMDVAEHLVDIDLEDYDTTADSNLYMYRELISL